MPHNGEQRSDVRGDIDKQALVCGAHKGGQQRQMRAGRDRQIFCKALYGRMQ
jgi:hypothetical protein